jgi:hypothetical protein
MVRLVKSRISVGRVWSSANCNVPIAVASFPWRPSIRQIEMNSIFYSPTCTPLRPHHLRFHPDFGVAS